MRSTKPLVLGERTLVVRCFMPSIASISSYGWLSGLPQLAAVVREHGFDGEGELLVEGQDAVVQQIAGGDRHLRGVDLREGHRARDVDDDLHVDLADALEHAPEERVLVEQLAWPGRFDVAGPELGAMAFEEPDLLVTEAEGRLASVTLEPEQMLVPGLDIMAEPNGSEATRAAPTFSWRSWLATR
jgi:hypothetical protein